MADGAGPGAGEPPGAGESLVGAALVRGAQRGAADGTGARDGVACVGGVVMDVLLRPVDHLPPPNRIERIDEASLAPGGCAANAASALARLGVTARFVGRVGADPLGDLVLATLAGRGVDVTGATRDPELPTPASAVFIYPDGERGIMTAFGATRAFGIEHVDRALVERSRVLFVAQFGLLGRFEAEAPALLAAARAAGITTALDTAWEPTGVVRDHLGACLPHLDILVPSLDEARAATGLDGPAAIAAHFHDAGVRIVGVKLGPDGCWISDRDAPAEAGLVPAFRVDAVDATGAGDAWCAGFLAAHLDGASAREAVRFANAVGALCVTGVGTYAGLRDRESTRRWIAEAAGAAGPE